MADNNTFDLEKFNSLMSCPCTICCGLWYMKSAMTTPPDAEKLSEDESKFYVDQMQGLWDIIPIEIPNMGMGNGQNTIGFLQVSVSGKNMNFSGGPGGQVQ